MRRHTRRWHRTSDHGRRAFQVLSKPYSLCSRGNSPGGTGVEQGSQGDGATQRKMAAKVGAKKRGRRLGSALIVEAGMGD
jgi:hypothetical protein